MEKIESKIKDLQKQDKELTGRMAASKQGSQKWHSLRKCRDSVEAKLLRIRALYNK